MRAFLGLGSNLGDKAIYLKDAVRKLGEYPKILVMDESGLYETEPWGETDQPLFWNQVVVIETELTPHDLLTVCQKIEQELGRVRIKRWGPRTVDIDILLYDNRIIKDERLIVPHPYLEEREFVLAPLREVAPDLILPSGRPISQTHGAGNVRRI